MTPPQRVKPAPPPMRRPVPVPAAVEPEPVEVEQEQEAEPSPRPDPQAADWSEMAARCDVLLAEIERMRQVCLRALGREK